jgi:N6-adenosine-specific RNA methylase IME4
LEDLMGRRRIHADDRTKWRENKRRQRHPTVRLVPATQTPGRYVTSLEDLLATGPRFGCIYADPPWCFRDDPPSVDMRKPYPPMPLEAICALPVRDLALPESHLNCWVTAAHLFDAAQVFAAWGCTLKSKFDWGKITKDFDLRKAIQNGQGICMGSGHSWWGSSETCLLGVRGNLTARKTNLRSLLLAPRGRPSEKPDRARARIEPCSPGPYLELFGRAAVPGWTVWGNQGLPVNGRLQQARVGSRGTAQGGALATRPYRNECCKNP